MIIDDRFPTTYSDTNYPLFEYERTDAIKSLGDGFENYWLGYMNYEKIPTVFFASEFSSTEDNVSAKVVNTPENSPVGYTTDSYSYGTLINTILKESDLSIGSSYSDYLNSFHVPSSAVQIDFSTGGTTGCQLWISVENGADASLGTHVQRDLKVLSDDDRSTTGLIEFLLGNRDITFTYTVNSTTVTHTLKSKDLEENGIVYFNGIANGLYYRISVFIAGYGFKPYPGKDSSGANQRTYHINPCLKMYSEIDNYYVIKSNCIYAGTNTRYDITTHTFYSLQSWGAYIPGIGALGGWNFEFSNDDLSDLSTYEILYNGNTVAYKLSDIVEMWRVYKPSDLVHHFALLMRIPSVVSYGYHTGIYCPEVLDDGEFTGNLLTGELTEDDVQPWQWGNIIDDDFTESDIPEYIPPGPEPSDWGDDRYGTVPGLWLGSDGITANFITPWVLRGSQVTNFGKFLWQNLFLPDPGDPSIINGLWKNFIDALGSYWQTGSFDTASTLDFVISLLYFPFKLDNLSSDSGVKKIYFGTGALGLTVSASYNSRRLTAYHGNLSGGSLDLTDSSVKSALGVPDDFRGLANTSACIYLPFCGTYQVNWADIKDSLLSITYAIDFTTGACTAYVLSTKKGKAAYVLTATGMVGFSVPLSATNANRLVSSILGGVAQSGTKFMDMGTSIGTKIMKGAESEKLSPIGGGSEDDIGNALTMSTVGGPVGSLAGSFTVAGKATKELFSKPSIGIPMMAGGSGWDALHCPRTPFLQVRTPQYIPDVGHGHAFGWPAEKQMYIGSLPTPSTRNYYECINVDTSTLSCTHEERQMIKAQLEAGFYIRG